MTAGGPFGPGGVYTGSSGSFQKTGSPWSHRWPRGVRVTILLTRSIPRGGPASEETSFS